MLSYTERTDLFSGQTPPTAHHRPFDDIHIHVLAFGREAGDFFIRWSQPIPSPIVMQAAKNAGGKRAILLPDPTTFNTKICSRNDLQGVSLMGGMRFFSGYCADGVMLFDTSEAFWLSSGDCHTVVIYDPVTKMTTPAHAGRASVMDEQRIGSGHPSRPHESVVDTAIERLKTHGIPCERLKVFICCGIGPKWFDHPIDHPVLGQWNGKMIRDVIDRYGEAVIHRDPKYGCLNMPEIIRTQCIRHGIQKENIIHDGVDTYSTKDKNGNTAYHSHRRTGKERNGVLVYRS